MSGNKAQEDIYKKLEELNKDEDYWIKPEFEEYYVASNKILLDLIKQVPHKRILEVGCAQGLFTRQLSEIADEVVALDVSESELERAREFNKDRKNITFHHVPLEKFSPDEKFDVIVCSEILYYILDKQKTISKLQSLGNYLVTSHFLFCWPYGSLKAVSYEMALRRFPLVKRVIQTGMKPMYLVVKALRALR